MQPARQPPAGRLKVGKVPRQCRLTTGPHHQQRGDKVAKRTALMPVCLRPHGVDIVLQASGQRVLCQSKPNSRTSSFSLPLAHLANVSRLQPRPSFYKGGGLKAPFIKGAARSAGGFSRARLEINTFASRIINRQAHRCACLSNSYQ